MPCLGLPHLQFLVSARPATNEHRNSRDAGLIFLEVVGAAEGVVADPVAVAEGILTLAARQGKGQPRRIHHRDKTSLLP